MADNRSLPYLNAHSNITKVLERIKAAETPTRFSQDYLATTLQMPGGSAKPVIPFLKRTGFLATDGTPTDLFKRFRGAHSGAAAAEALRIGYQPVFAINEYAHDASDKKLKELIIQATGAGKESRAVKSTAASFKALKSFADFSDTAQVDAGEAEAQDTGNGSGRPAVEHLGRIQLGYTVNLHLPASSDVAVFDAIFRSLKEHLVQ